jgi:hypothetical protein
VLLAGFCPFGHEGSCQLLSIRVSTAATIAAYIELSFEDIRGLLGKYNKNMYELFPKVGTESVIAIMLRYSFALSYYA